jgi:hypothetical protein
MARTCFRVPAKVAATSNGITYLQWHSQLPISHRASDKDFYYHDKGMYHILHQASGILKAYTPARVSQQQGPASKRVL